jgi:hypothetical protein
MQTFLSIAFVGITGSPFRSQNKRAQEFGVHIYYWMYVHSAPFMATRFENFPI